MSEFDLFLVDLLQVTFRINSEIQRRISKTRHIQRRPQRQSRRGTEEKIKILLWLYSSIVLYSQCVFGNDFAFYAFLLHMLQVLPNEIEGKRGEKDEKH
jgi:hypothetical protein